MPLQVRGIASELGEGRRIARWPLAVLRVYVGAVFAIAGVRQLGNMDPWVTVGQRWSSAVHDQLSTWEPHSATWYHGILTHLLIPNANLIAPLVAWSHVVIGTALILGLSTRLAAATGLMLLLQYTAAAGGRLYSPGPAAVYTAALLAVLLAGAGRTWGVDAVLARRWPRTLLW